MSNAGYILHRKYLVKDAEMQGISSNLAQARAEHIGPTANPDDSNDQTNNDPAQVSQDFN